VEIRQCLGELQCGRGCLTEVIIDGFPQFRITFTLQCGRGPKATERAMVSSGTAQRGLINGAVACQPRNTHDLIGTGARLQLLQWGRGCAATEYWAGKGGILEFVELQ
jgi:hypothetical protein